ncbi:hypothetical protein ABI59_15010 [Acidobacteria bacterium Mor1]|nr:hypothetical protein ABI59_15010 [Acidobacteria bacterium Mor1]
MIVRRTLKWRVIVRYSYRFLLYALATSGAAYVTRVTLGLESAWIPFSVVALLGTALAIFVAFRNNSSYDRWWEARKIWGGIVNSSRNWGRQVVSLVDASVLDGAAEPAAVDEVRRELIYRHLAWVNTLRLQLRNQQDWKVLEPFLEADELEDLDGRANRATQLVRRQGERLVELLQTDAPATLRLQQLEGTLSELYNLQGQAERIKNTPFPRQYDYFTRVFVYVFTLLLPFGLVEMFLEHNAPWLILPVTVVVCYMFWVLQNVARLNEDPFENRIQDTPMSALSRTIEIDLRDMLGEKDLPPRLLPKDGFLF